METLRVLVADTTDPYFNLATEDWIFQDMDPSTKVLFLWRNEESIIVGRGQNVWSECLLEEAEKDGVHIVRRHSGGGAVYQDLGNTCFTLMRAKDSTRTSKELYAENIQILIGALQRLGVSAQSSGRNDLVVEREGQAYKISGSAFKESKDRCFHHGTMLMNVDLSRLSSYLTPDNQKLMAKGIKSVRARVMNLTELHAHIDHGSFTEALIEQFFHHFGRRCEVEHLNRESLGNIDSLALYYDKLKSWDWIYGKTPHFQHSMKERFAWGSCELHLDTNKGHISEAVVYTDSLHPEVFEKVGKFLSDKPYNRPGIVSAQLAHLAESPELADLLQEFYTWVGEQI